MGSSIVWEGPIESLASLSPLEAPYSPCPAMGVKQQGLEPQLGANSSLVIPCPSDGSVTGLLVGSGHTSRWPGALYAPRALVVLGGPIAWHPSLLLLLRSGSGDGSPVGWALEFPAEGLAQPQARRGASLSTGKAISPHAPFQLTKVSQN